MRVAGILLSVLILCAAPIRAELPPEKVQAIYDAVTPSLVGVQFTYDGELGRIDVVGLGVVVSPDGLVMYPLALTPPSMPDAQLVDFKLLIPHLNKPDEQINAVFQGRDERNNVAFVKADAQRDWTAVKFEETPIEVGQHVISVGLLPKLAGYRPYLMQATVAGKLRGEIPTILVSGGGLAAVGSPVFNEAGKAIGFVNSQEGKGVWLHTTSGGASRRDQRINPLQMVDDPPNLFVASEHLLQSLNDPPKGGESIKLPWLGAPQLAGVKEDVAELFGIKDQPAAEVGDLVPGGPAEKGGLRVGMKIIKINGQPLPRGDEDDEVPLIFTRKIVRMKPGETVTLTVLEQKDQPPRDIQIKLGDRPKAQNLARRFFAEDLGFSAREMVFQDTYVRRKPQDFKGVVVALVKPQSNAQSAKLDMNDVITSFNNQPVNDLDQFEKDYKEFRRTQPTEAIVLVVMKTDGSTQTIRIEPPQ